MTSAGIVGPLTWNALFAQQPVPPPSLQRIIVLDPGHGGSDFGAVLGSRRESDDTLKLALEVKKLLEAQGQQVIMTRSTDIFVSLSERSAISNRNNADLFVSIHRNASSSSAANGVENFVFTTAPTSTVRAAFDVLDEVVTVGVQNNRGVKRGNFAVLRSTHAPAMLLEMGFITNIRDNELFDQNLYAYATAIARGIMQSLSETHPPQSYTFYTIESGDSLWSIAQKFGTTQNVITLLNKLTSSNVVEGQILKVPR